MNQVKSLVVGAKYSQISTGWSSQASELITADLQEFIPFTDDELVESGGLVVKGQRCVIPRDVRQFILDRLHSSHQGFNSFTEQESLFSTLD